MKYQIQIHSTMVTKPLIFIIEENDIETTMQNLSRGTISWSHGRKTGYWINPTSITLIRLVALEDESKAEQENPQQTDVPEIPPGLDEAISKDLQHQEDMLTG